MLQASSLEDYPMIKIPAGSLELRDDRRKTTWMVEVKSFSLAQVPVTKELYFSILQKSIGLNDYPQTPVVNVSWNEAILFCNLLSKQSGLKECYTISEKGESVSCNWDADGYRLPTEAEWQHACKAGTSGYRYGELGRIAWYHDNSEGVLHEVVQRSQIHGSSTICWGTCGSGVGIYMMRMYMDPIGFSVAEAGQKRLEVVGQLAAVEVTLHFKLMI
jgi:hypothetical protein